MYKGMERSPSPTLTAISSTGGFSFGRKTRGFWDKPTQTIMRNNVILHSTQPATGRAGGASAPGPGVLTHWGHARRTKRPERTALPAP